MITPFEIYLVLQLDSIRTTLGFATFLLGFATFFTTFIGFLSNGQLAVRGKLVALLVVVAVLGAVVPSSRTAAAMIILPALTSDEVVQPIADEAKELYTLAKEALKDAVDPAK